MSIFDDILQDAKVAAIDVESGNVTTTAKQQSFDWFMARLGRFTASRIPDLMTNGRGKAWGETAIKYVSQLAVERSLSDDGKAEYVLQMMGKEFPATRWGNEKEPLAKAELIRRGYEVEEVFFQENKDFPYFGGSADFLTNGMPGEIKCPFDPLVHEANIQIQLTGINDSHRYYGQLQAHIFNYDAKQALFVSYDPRRVASKQLALIIVERDGDYISKMVDRIEVANHAIQNYLSGGIPISETLNLK